MLIAKKKKKKNSFGQVNSVKWYQPEFVYQRIEMTFTVKLCDHITSNRSPHVKKKGLIY